MRSEGVLSICLVEIGIFAVGEFKFGHPYTL